MTDTDPTPSLDAFLAAYDEDDNEWWYLASGDHLNLFDEAVERMRAAEARHAADRAAGIVRVDTNDEALVERLGILLAGYFSHGGDAEHAYRVNPRYRIYAGKILAALREAP